MKTSSKHKNDDQEQLELQGNIGEDFIISISILICVFTFLPFFRSHFKSTVPEMCLFL